ncbi:centrosomal protein of 170 kDa protein B [Trichomycterus rosablanca]|uniref:centrosomal protein of 170 kDa protein B n=1 Tax=Trichomycterus rosablanca TaxID=2290929 RepID=UPI002F352A3A
MSVTSWFLVSSSGTRHRLPREMIFVGREDCELMLQSRSVDKQHAVINYSPTTDQHLLKDLGSLNGTFVNDQRIPDQTYVTLKLSDLVRFGYDSHVYVLERSQHKVPEEALKHEKYTSQLQMEIKSSEIQNKEAQEERKLDRSERKSLTEAPVCRPTPLYGQPSWWGEEDPGNKDPLNEGRKPDESRSDVQKVSEVNGSLQEFRDAQNKSFLYHREPSYFEIPTKEVQSHPKYSELELNDIPTKDTDALPKPTPTPPVYQSHASFTIEFDDCTPGKMKIKDHVTKFSSRQRTKAPPGIKTISPAPLEVQSAESKVADWLVHSDVGVMSSRRPTSDDVYSTKSDLAMHVPILKDHHHEDGTQSDSEDPAPKGTRTKSHHAVQSEQPTVPKVPEQSEVKPSSPCKADQSFSEASERALKELSPPAQIRSGAQEPLSQQAFIIEFFDDNPRKKRSQSFTHNPLHGDNYAALRAKLERRKGAERPASVHGNLPPTQQITVPLKGPGHSAHQRSSSLKREKTDEVTSKGATSPSSSGTSCSITSSSSRSSPSVTIRPFGSVGKKSKLVQEFLDESTPPMSAPPVMMSPSHARLPSPDDTPACRPSSVSYPSSPSQIHGHALSQTLPSPPAASPPVPVPVLPPPQTPESSASSLPPFSPRGGAGADPKAPRGLGKVPGTGRTEEEDSLSDAGTYTIETESQDKEVEEARSMIDQVFGVLDAPEYSGVYRPVISEQDLIPQTHIIQTSAEDLTDLNSSISADPESFIQDPADLAGPRWVSRWASLADTYSESASTAPPSGPSAQREGIRSTSSLTEDHSESDCTQISKTRRLLPQVPPTAGEKQESTTPSILIRTEPSLDRDPSEKTSRTSQPDSANRLRVQEDVDHDSLSDTSRSDDSSILDRSLKGHRGSENVPPKSTSFYIGSEDRSGKSRSPGSSQTERAASPKVPPTTVLIRHLSGQESRRPVKPNFSAPNLQTQHKDLVPTKEAQSSAFVRQESFTKERPSDHVPVKRLPHISSHPALRDLGAKVDETENKPPSSFQHPKQPAEESLSEDSDVDTASTVSLVSSKNAPVCAPKRRPTSSGAPRKDKSSSQDKTRQLTARERLSEKRRSHVAPEKSAAKTEGTRHLHLRRSAGNSGSLDLSDSQNLADPPESGASDHESVAGPSTRKKLSDQNKSSKAPAHQVLTRSNSLSAPRPTRASMLRRARLGDASDNEGGDTDRASQSSEHTKPAGDPRKLSRLDILAMPRKRTGSFTAPSDNEAATKQAHGRPAEATGRKMSSGDTKQPNKISPTAEKHSSARTRSNQAKHASAASSRRRQKGSDFSSTSDEERDSGAKPKSSSSTQTSQKVSRTQLDLEEDEQNQHYQTWTNHSAEIARLSQDLAKDLAILAREIHDVAGDPEPPAALGTSSTGSAPTTPTISAREELVHHIPEASLNYQKVPAGSPSPVDQESDGTKRRPWNREEVILDNLMLNPVSQLSQAIRENTEQLTEKIKTLYQNKSDVWEKIESRINAEDEVPLIKTSNKEISSILQELRRVQRQLEVINSVVEPGAATKVSAPATAKKRSTPGGAKRSTGRGSETQK